MCVCMFVCVYVCIYVCMYVCMYVFMYVAFLGVEALKKSPIQGNALQEMCMRDE